VRNATKDRLIISGVVLAALPFVISSVPWTHTTVERSLHLCPWAHMTLEASLNVLWVVLAVGAFVHWTAPASSRLRSRLSRLISLVFVLALLFPVISADDDLAQLDLINDAKTSQAITLDLKSHSQPATAAPLNPLALPASAFVVSLFPHFELVFAPARGLSVATPGATTGNHSPPLC
jgi:hypothetical protein